MDALLSSGLSARFQRSRLLCALSAAVIKKPRLALVVFLSMVAGVIFLLTNFCTRGYPGRDSGVFLYIAQVILDGKIPYRDAWDNKPPGIFYIDALGLLLGRGSVLGVWLVEYVSLCVSVLLSVKVLDRAFGLGAAFFGSMSWLIGLMLLFTMGGPNLTEEYAIPYKFAAFWLFLEAEDKGYIGWRGFALGVTGAMALLFRQNLIGVHLALAAYILLTRVHRRQVRRFLAEWLWILLGGAMVLAAVGAYFAANSALGDLIDVAFLYNFLYSASSMQSRFDSVFAGFDVLSRSGIGIIAAASWVAGLVFLATGRQLPRDARRILVLAIIAFPIEMVLSSVSTREFGHYYQAWLPVIGVLAGFFARYLVAGWTSPESGRQNFREVTLFSALALGMAVMPVYATMAEALPLGRSQSAVAHAADYVRQFTQPGDYVLVWGMEPSINFVSQRRAPSKFIHLYPLLTRGYETPAMVQEFLSELEAHPPALIIDTSPVNGLVPPIDDSRREGWERWGPDGIYRPSKDLDAVFAYLNKNYKERGPLVQPEGAVFVYERRQTAQK